jgi:acetylornithine deacetylase/succinyl-diaminopimelate desuccinylase-like protein
MERTGDIRAKLEKLEALFARGATPGERAAAGAALDRLTSKMTNATDEGATELQYSLPDTWAVRIFVALCRKHGVKPYRYPRQRRTTVMVRVQPDAFERTVMSEFKTLHGELVAYFQDTVDHLIADAMRSDGDDSNMETPKIGR